MMIFLTLALLMASANDQKRWDVVSGKALSVIAGQGVLVSPDDSGRSIMLACEPGETADGARVNAEAYLDGVFSYRSASGALRTVKRYNIGTKAEVEKRRADRQKAFEETDRRTREDSARFARGH